MWSEGDAPLESATDQQLGLAVESNLFALFEAMTTLPGAVIDRSPELSKHLAPPQNPMFKGAWASDLSDLSERSLDGVIDATIAWFDDAGSPFFFWWTGPGTAPDSLGERLADRGLIPMKEQTELAPGIVSHESGSPGMAADLRTIDESLMHQVPAGFSIERVTPETLDEFGDVLASGMGIPRPLAGAWVDAARSVPPVASVPWSMYLGRLDGVPVATNMGFNGAGVASVYGVATVPEHRGVGIGGAITLAPLLEARDAGYRYAVLFSSLIGVHAYERIGFRVIDDVWIDRYLWMRPGAG